MTAAAAPLLPVADAQARLFTLGKEAVPGEEAGKIRGACLGASAPTTVAAALLWRMRGTT